VAKSACPLDPDDVGDEMIGSVSEIRSFLQKTSRLLGCASVEDLLEATDELLLGAVDFVFCRLYLLKSLACAAQLPGQVDGDMRLVRAACPEDLSVDWDLACWALKHGEVALFPASQVGGAESMIVVPLRGRTMELGAVILWVDFNEAGFTGQSADLMALCGRGISTALEGLELSAQRARTQAFIQSVLESVPVGILSLDRGGAVTFINGTAEFMLGRQHRETVGLEYSRAFPGEVNDLVRQVVGRLDRNEDAGEEELDFTGGGGEGYVLGVSGTRLTLPGSDESAGYVFVIRDLEVTKEVTRLRELDGMKDDLLSLVSHELRTPLASIMAYAEALLMEGMIDTEEERREYLEVIRGEGERLGRLINDVLDLTKMQAGKLEYHFDEYDLSEVARHAINVQAALADKKGVSLRSEFAPDLPQVRIDRDRIIQVLCNLLSNAIKYTDENGSVTVYTRMPQLEPGEPACMELRVVDNGVGIPAGQIHKVWSRFEQVENARHHTGGTGLGMPICRQIVEDGHGGKIWLTSEVGVGTTVHCRLPL
jgi:PAS domain S-box-containing protein